MSALIKRHFLLYFRNRSGVILSLMGAMISFVLYLIFLRDNIRDQWSQLPDASQLLDLWLVSGTLAIIGLTTTFSGLSQLVDDREKRVDQDLFITDLGSWGLSLSYLISATLIGFFMQMFTFTFMMAYFIWVDKISYDWKLTLPLLLLMLTNALVCTMLNSLVLHYVKSLDSLGNLATILGAASGFLVGSYIPIGSLPDFAQNLMKATPSAYIASLFRQFLMKDKIAAAFSSAPNQVRLDFEKHLGVRIQWQELLTKKETFYIVGVVLMGSLLLWLLQQWISKRRRVGL